MNTADELDEGIAAEITARAWDDYLHQRGAEAYISARYGCVSDMRLGPCPDRAERAAAKGPRPVRPGLAQAA